MSCMSPSDDKPASQLGTGACRDRVREINFLGIYESNIKEITHFRWLYSQFLAEDANFKQKARARSNISKDPPLGPGWGTFVENEAYLEYVSKAPNKTEVIDLDVSRLVAAYS
jgi:hypothetical protein